ncbi:MAG: T4SS guanine nucleotide exchange effector RalF [Candidatus Rickettsia vulgarisii]
MSKDSKSSNDNYIRTSSIESGYESDTPNRMNYDEGLPEVVVNSIASFRTGMNYMKGYISDELIKIAANNNGIVDINNTQFKEACKALLESDPTLSPGSYSVLAEVKGIEEKINKLITGESPEKMGIDEKYFTEFRQELYNYQDLMHKQLSNNEGINQLIDQRLINKNIFLHMNLYERGEDSQPKALTPQDKINFLSKVTSYIQNIPQELRREVILSIKAGKNPSLDKLTNDAIISAFATYGDETKTWGILDKEKITEENIKNFSDSINQIIKNENTNLVTRKFFDEAVQSIELKEKDITITTEQKEKIYKRLFPEFEALNSDQYLDNPNQLISEIASKIVDTHKGIQDIDTNKIEIIRQFNIKPKSGIDVLQKICEKHGLNISTELADLFITEKKQINLEHAGDYLSGPDQSNQNTLKSFVDQIDFKDKPFTSALREYLQTFKLPGEAQKIDRLVEAFSAKYYKDNNTQDIDGKDAAYLLAFQSIMLNSDLHKPGIKNKMTFEQLKKNLNGTNNGHNFPNHLLEGLYKDIKAKPFELNFIETAPGYNLKTDNLSNDPAYKEIKEVFKDAKVRGNIIKDSMEITVKQPKSWLTKFTGYEGSMVIKDKDGASATVQLYQPNTFSRWFLGEKSKVIIQPGRDGKGQLDKKNIDLAAKVIAGFKTIEVKEQDIGVGYDYLKEDLLKAYTVAKEKGKFTNILPEVANQQILNNIGQSFKPMPNKDNKQSPHVSVLKRSNAFKGKNDIKRR